MEDSAPLFMYLDACQAMTMEAKKRVRPAKNELLPMGLPNKIGKEQSLVAFSKKEGRKWRNQGDNRVDR